MKKRTSLLFTTCCDQPGGFGRWTGLKNGPPGAIFKTEPGLLEKRVPSRERSHIPPNSWHFESMICLFSPGGSHVHSLEGQLLHDDPTVPPTGSPRRCRFKPHRSEPKMGVDCVRNIDRNESNSGAMPWFGSYLRCTKKTCRNPSNLINPYFFYWHILLN